MPWCYLLLLAPVLFTPIHAGAGAWTLTQPGTTGVSAMQLVLFDEVNLLAIDKLESNPMMTEDGQHALGSVMNLKTGKKQPLKIKTNSFCAGGSFLSNGTLANVGGNEQVTSGGTTSPDGRQAVRLIDCKPTGVCTVFDDPNHVGMASSRWYPSGARLDDGSIIIIGGVIAGDWTNNPIINNPTYEFFPPKSIHGNNGIPTRMPFLVDTMPHNLFPHCFVLPDGKLLILANNQAMIFDWKTNTETRLPNLPKGQRCTYPMSAAAVLLPLKPENNYEPEVLVCGGSDISDEVKANEISSNTPAIAQCSRMMLTPKGIAEGWKTEQMPQPRMMPNAVLMPDGKVLIVNGATGGTAGYGNVMNQVGQSNADGPVLQPVIYDPDAPEGQRFSNEGLPTSDIPRMYHSTATLSPDGTIIIAGSNPNLDVSTQKYPTEYRMETFSPSYVMGMRPEIVKFNEIMQHGLPYVVLIRLPLGMMQQSAGEPPKISISIMDLGFSTHGVHMDQRMVMLPSTSSFVDPQTMLQRVIVTMPKDTGMYPPGPAWIVCSVDGVPSVMKKVMVGTGASPPVDQGAIDNMLSIPPVKPVIGK